MLPYKVKFYQEAQTDFNRIVDYMQYILYSRQAAITFAKKVKAKISMIAKDPYAYEPHQINRLVYRFANVNKYLIAFRIDEKTRTVHIIAIGHSLQNRRNIVKHRK